MSSEVFQTYVEDFQPVDDLHAVLRLNFCKMRVEKGGREVWGKNSYPLLCELTAIPVLTQSGAMIGHVSGVRDAGEPNEFEFDLAFDFPDSFESHGSHARCGFHGEVIDTQRLKNGYDALTIKPSALVLWRLEFARGARRAACG